LNQEIKRRTHVVRIFPSRESCLRLILALAVETHEDWLESPRYLNMDDLREHKKTADASSGMSGVLATTTVASCSTPSRTLCSASSGGLRPSLTAPAHNALASSDRNEETPRFNQTKKHHRQKPKPLLHSLTDTTPNQSSRTRQCGGCRDLERAHCGRRVQRVQAV